MKELPVREDVLLVRSLTMMGVIIGAWLLTQHPRISSALYGPIGLGEFILNLCTILMLVTIGVIVCHNYKKLFHKFLPRTLLERLPEKTSVAAFYLVIYGVVLMQGDLSIFEVNGYMIKSIVGILIIIGFVSYITAGTYENYPPIVISNEYEQQEEFVSNKPYLPNSVTGSVIELGKILCYPLLVLLK